MGVLVTIHDDRPDRYPLYLEKRAGKRSGIEFGATSVEKYERGLLEDGERVADAGYDPGRYYQILGYELEEIPETEGDVAEAFALGHDGRRAWSTDEVAWMAEACYDAGIERLATVCYCAIELNCTVESTQS